MFMPHLTVVQQGTTVDFLNSDTVAHNVFWTSVGGNKKLGHNLGTWPKGEKKAFKFDNPGRGAAALQRAPGDVRHISSCRPRLISPTTDNRRLQDRERSGWQLQRDGVA